MEKLTLGSYYKFSSTTQCDFYSIESLPEVDRSITDRRVKSYDHMLHRSLDKIFREGCLSSGGQIQQFLRDVQLKSKIKPLLEREPVLSRYCLKEELPLLWFAVLAGYEKSTELLVRSGADVNEPFGRHDPQVIYEKWTVLYVLLQMRPSQENEQLSRLVVDHGADLKSRDYMGRSILHYAVKKGRVQMTKMLLDKGADVNAADDNGVTPLLAVDSKADELMPMLMEYGADIFAKSIYDENALHRLSCADPREPVVDLARVLIEKGVSVDDKNWTYFYQPIHLAVQNGRNELVKLYLDHGANVNAQTKLGESPLHFAVSETGNDYAVMKTLLNRGADINLKTIHGHTALHAACQFAALPTALFLDDPYEVESVIRQLLYAGADVLAEDCKGKTPLALISSSGKEKPPGIWLLVRMLALKKAHQPSVELKDKIIIEGDPTLQNYYRACLNEIDTMKCTRFAEACTLFELLTKSLCQIAAYMRNPEFESNFVCFNCNSPGLFIYVENVHEVFKRAKKRYHTILRTENVINEAVYERLPHIILRKVAHYTLNCCEYVE